MTGEKKSLVGWPYKFLILCRHGIGDIVWALPLLTVLARRFPKSCAEWLVDEEYLPLLEGRPELSHIVTMPRPDVLPLLKPFRPLYRWFVIFVEFVGRLRDRLYAASLDVEDSPVVRWLARLAGARLRIGPRGVARCRWLNNCRVELNNDPARTHMVWRALRLLDGWEEETQPPEAPGMVIRPETLALRDEMLTRLKLQAGGYVILHPGAPFASRMWTVDGFAQVASHLYAKYGLKSLVLWGKGERGTSWDVENGSQGAAVVSPEADLALQIALLAGCKACVAVDSGPLHIASAMNIPTVGLFGPTDPAVRRPFWGESRVISRWPEARKYAYKPKADRPCPHMETITAAEVIKAVEEVLGMDAKEETSAVTAAAQGV